MSDQMSIETRTAKSIEHTYRRDAVQRRPARKCPSPGASLTKEWKSPDHPKHSCEQTGPVLAGARKSAVSSNGDRDGCDHQWPINLDTRRSIVPRPRNYVMLPSFNQRHYSLSIAPKQPFRFRPLSDLVLRAAKDHFGSIP